MTLLDACKQKTNVVERVSGKLETVGEKMDELCHGYLVGAYDALIESRSICAPNDPPSPEYLLSILELYLAALSRLPTAGELKAGLLNFASRPKQQAAEDLLWALLNTKEFAYIR